ncbi:AAA family [Colletotrichum plurivorum]|uniref:AAA family n=1 Tax=Colletotrichum plurivorum TaxID=2175906 RepID=A0A8H6MRM8_9PEZI|nr:AAA family [Colletotrichum plurivorum]
MATEIETTVPSGTDVTESNVTAPTPSTDNVVAAQAESKQESAETDLGKKVDKMTEAINDIVSAQKNKRPEPKPMEPFTRTIPKVRESRSWDEFMNHHGSDDHSYAIETLVAGDSLKTEKEEASFQVEMEDFRLFGQQRGFGHRFRGQHKTVVDGGDEVWLQRMRINSSFVMMHLGRQCSAGKQWNRRPHVFQRPFRYLIHFHSEMKAVLAELEASSATSAPEPADGRPPQGSEPTRVQEHLEPDTLGIESLFSNSDALADMRLYVKLIDEQVMPDYIRFQGRDGSLPDKIRWDDLWYLFRPGDLIYVPNTKSGVRARIPMGWASNFQLLQGGFGDAGISSSLNSGHASRGSSTDQMIWKVYRPPHRVGSIDDCYCSACLRGETHWTVCCYHIDYDGQNYRAVGRSIEIQQFDGEKDITQLACYPIRFVQGKDGVTDRGRKNGRKFVAHIDPGRRYAFYRGWTLIKTPLGEAVEDVNGKPLTSPEHVESEILVDFEEAFNKDPSWKPEFLTVEAATHKIVVSKEDGFPLHEWHDSQRSDLKCSWEDRVVKDDGVDVLQQNDFIKTDLLLSSKRDTEMGDIEGDNLALLPRRLFAYALWERRFVQVDVGNVQFPELKDKDRAFDNLQIPDEARSFIQSLVYSHFKKRMNESSVDIASQDLIRGKGKGIVILLFGVPGVGKTATAEAVAQKFEKPLFPITCGDLGFTPESVESSLTEIFRLAHLWDCVLLLDEADVFITQRDRKDLERNALVSVFLRMLEYYNGILFLTTNRPGVLDEAVKSRVHLNLRYDFLSMDQMTAIFKINIQRLREIEEQAAKAPGHTKLHVDEQDIIEFAKEHWKNNTNSIGRWNGRQIRNAFLVAASLAHYEGDETGRPEGLQKQLTSKHFKKVEDTTKRYDKYRAACLGDTDSYHAYDRAERDDGWTPHVNIQAGGGYGAPDPGRRESTAWQRPAQSPMGMNEVKRQGGLGMNDIMGIYQPPSTSQPPGQPPLVPQPSKQQHLQQQYSHHGEHTPITIPGGNRYHYQQAPDLSRATYQPDQQY